MEPRKLNNMYKKFKVYAKKEIIKTMMLKNGEKHKAESLLKKLFKQNLKTLKANKLLPLIKLTIIYSTNVLTETSQIIKRGKKKRKIATTTLVLNEKSRYKDAWKKFIESKTTDKSFVVRTSEKIEGLATNDSFNKFETTVALRNNNSAMKKKKIFKFRW